jgi:hypothetical protein
MALNRHRRYTVSIQRHSAVPSPAARDIALSGFCVDAPLGVNLGPGPDRLDLRSRMRWHPPAAGFRTVTFSDGLLILGGRAAKALPTVPGKPVTRAQRGAGVLTKVVSPFLPGSEFVHALAEVAADAVIDALGEGYERAHPEREQAWLQSKADWQRAFADQVSEYPDVHAVPRVDIVDVSIVPFMVFGLSVRLVSQNGDQSAYTFRTNAPARQAAAEAGFWFRGRLERELVWLSDARNLKENESSHAVRDLRELLPAYSQVPECVTLLDERLPEWRSALSCQTPSPSSGKPPAADIIAKVQRSTLHQTNTQTDH